MHQSIELFQLRGQDGYFCRSGRKEREFFAEFILVPAPKAALQPFFIRLEILKISGYPASRYWVTTWISSSPKWRENRMCSSGAICWLRNTITPLALNTALSFLNVASPTSFERSMPSARWPSLADDCRTAAFMAFSRTSNNLRPALRAGQTPCQNRRQKFAHRTKSRFRE